MFDSYRPAVGAISQREKGSLLAHEQGVANPFGIAGKQNIIHSFVHRKQHHNQINTFLSYKNSNLSTQTTYPIVTTGAQDRGRMFIENKDDVYKDMIIGVHQRPGDLAVNVCKTKALTNMRAAGSDDNVKVIPPLELNLDIAVEYIAEDELVEVTPTKVRMLKHPEWKDWAKKRRDL